MNGSQAQVLSRYYRAREARIFFSAPPKFGKYGGWASELGANFLWLFFNNNSGRSIWRIFNLKGVGWGDKTE